MLGTQATKWSGFQLPTIAPETDGALTSNFSEKSSLYLIPDWVYVTWDVLRPATHAYLIEKWCGGWLLLTHH